MLTYTIAETDHCRRAESFLRNLLPAAPLSYLHKIITSGHFSINGAPASSLEATLFLHDEISIKESGRLRSFLTGKRPELDVLFEDQWIIVFNKAPGLAVHRAAEVEQNLVERAQAFLRRRDRVPETSTLKLRPVNRLDRGTSGAIVLAKSPTAAGIFGRMVREEGFGKLYLAITEGTLPPEGTITAPLDGKESETRYRVLFQGERQAFAAVTPLTGRMHQIRQHFRLIGHPILGDRRYGGRMMPGFPGHALHSFRTSFTHPVTGKVHQIHAPLPEPFLALLKQLAADRYDRVAESLASLNRQAPQGLE